MKHVRWIFVAILLFSLTSFIDKGRPTSGLSVGNVAPDFSLGNDKKKCLEALKGNYVLLSFWASYDASARTSNTLFDHALKDLSQNQHVEMVSVSFDEYPSIFNETIKQDQLESSHCYVDISGEASNLFDIYHLNRGFSNYLLDKEGIIIAKNITVDQLSDYIK